jgi:hypothetical protein
LLDATDDAVRRNLSRWVIPASQMYLHTHPYAFHEKFVVRFAHAQQSLRFVLVDVGVDVGVDHSFPHRTADGNNDNGGGGGAGSITTANVTSTSTDRWARRGVRELYKAGVPSRARIVGHLDVRLFEISPATSSTLTRPFVDEWGRPITAMDGAHSSLATRDFPSAGVVRTADGDVVREVESGPLFTHGRYFIYCYLDNTRTHLWCHFSILFRACNLTL